MTRDALKTLFHPFESGEIESPAMGKVLFMGAEPGFRLPEGFLASVTLVQGFRPHLRALEAAGHTVSPRAQDKDFDAALILCGRHRGQNENWIADALERVKQGGLIVVAGGKEDGIASLRKRVADLLPLDGQMPKYHGAAFWFRRPEDASPAIEALRAGNGEIIVDGRFRTRPGMFSHDRIDTGSRLLAESLPADLSGAVADFCAGWGYVAAEIAGKSPGIKSIDLYEADFESIEAAKANLAFAAAAGITTRFFWQDLLAEPVAEHYSAIVMNPPFHQGRAAEPTIGQGMIKAAASALRRGGRLFMVANIPLPYEATLGLVFGGYTEIRRDGGFKILSAQR